MFNIAGFHIPKQLAFKHGTAILDKLGWQHPGLKPLGHDKRLYTKLLNEEDLEKQEEYWDCDREEYLGIHYKNVVITITAHLSLLSESILEDLSPYDVRQLIMMEDEMEETKVRCDLLIRRVAKLEMMFLMRFSLVHRLWTFEDLVFLSL